MQCFEGLKRTCCSILEARKQFALLAYLSEQAALYGLVIIVPFYFDSQRPGQGAFWTSIFFTSGYAGMILGDVVMTICCKYFQPSSVLATVVLGGMLAYAGQGFIADPLWICVLRGVSAFLTTGVPTNVYVITSFSSGAVVEFFNIVPGLSYIAEMVVPGIVTPLYTTPWLGWRYCVLALAALALPSVIIWVCIRHKLRKDHLQWLAKKHENAAAVTNIGSGKLSSISSVVRAGYLRCLAGRVLFIFFKHFNTIVPPMHMALYLNMNVTTIGMINMGRGCFNALVALVRVHPILIKAVGPRRAQLIALSGLCVSLCVTGVPQLLGSSFFVIALPFTNFFAMLYFLSVQSAMHDISERFPASAPIMIGVNEMTSGMAVLASAPLSGFVAGKVLAFSLTQLSFGAIVGGLLLHSLCIAQGGNLRRGK